MKTKHVFASLILLMIAFSGFFGIATAADAQEVHALLICLGDDLNIRASVNVNEEKMTELLGQVSKKCDVDLTIMKSVKARRGIVTKMTLSNATTISVSDQEQGLITTKQVIDWFKNLRPKAEDTVLVYYNGHGKAYGKTHMLHFDDGTNDLYNRDELRALLSEKQARLKLLITDTCKNQVSTPIPRSTVYATVREKNRSYTEHLFLQHRGLLDITAASTNQFALANDLLGGFFTAALIESFSEKSDMKREGGIGNSDGFLSWDEVFAKCVWETQDLFSQSSPQFDIRLSSELAENNQTTQTPEHFSLPIPINGGGGSSVPPKRPDPIASTAILNFTSTPSGANIEIDGFVVGKTPLNYELETDGQSSKEIEVTIKAAGYTDAVQKFRVQRGKPFEWNFELTKKAPEIPQTIRGPDGAEMMLIPAGEFQMGSNDSEANEQPVHTVYVDAFYIDKYEVTNAQFKKFVDANPTWQKDRIADRFHDEDYLALWSGNNYPSGEADHPVVYVSWYAAMAYAEWAGKRLPTEAEWEKAARGGLAGKGFPWGNTIKANQANYGWKVGTTTPVGRYPANGYGLHDMTGNVWEWCLDEYDSRFYRGSPRRNPIAGGSIAFINNNYTNINTSRVLRGGSWNFDADFARVALRDWGDPPLTDDFYGFRCARAVQ